MPENVIAPNRKGIFRDILAAALLAACYFLSGKMGLYLASVNPSASAVWPPTGLALATLLLLGHRLWPAVWVAAFFVNWTTTWLVAPSVLIATGNTLEAVLGAYLVNRFAGGRAAFEQPAWIVRFVLLAAMLSTMVSATMGIGTLLWTGSSNLSDFYVVWFTWWVGDMVSNLILAPLILVWTRRTPFGLSFSKAMEIFGFVVVLLLIAWLVFGDLLFHKDQHNPLGYLTLLPLLYACFRFGTRGAVTTTFVVASFAVFGCWQGTGPFVKASPAMSLVFLQAFMGTLAVTGVLLSCVITKQRLAEAFLREGEEAMRLIVENALDAVITADAQGRIIGWNPQAEKIFGWRKNEVMGKELAETLIPERYRQEHRRGLERFNRTGVGPLLNKRVEVFAVDRDGREFPVELSVSPMRSGNVTRFSAFIRDISDRKRTEEEIRHYAEDLKRSNEELEQFAFVASHDLQEPLRKITSFSNLIREKSEAVLEDDTRDYMLRMDKAASRMKKLIEDLLQYSRVTRRSSQFQAVDLDRVLRDVLTDLDARVQETGAKIRVERLPTLQADPLQIRQLFQNLLANALKFRDKERAPEVRVRYRAAQDGWHEFRVEDNGIGFDERYIEKIFLPFQRLYTREEYEGTGMGLPLCRKIVDAHGGQITAKSAPDKGSIFIVRFPAVSRKGVAA